MSTPSIACIGVIGKHDNPLHISIFPPYNTAPSPQPPSSSSSLLEFSLLLSSALDLFDARVRDRSRIDQDLGLLQHVDERLSLWGWLTGTGVKFVVVVDAWGKDGAGAGGRAAGAGGGGASRAGGLERSTTGLSEKGGSSGGKKGGGGRGGRDGLFGDADVRVAFKALQTAYIRLLQNPFYVPDEHTPIAVAQGKGQGSGEITSQKFVREVRRIGEGWKPGLSVI